MANNYTLLITAVLAAMAFTGALYYASNIAEETIPVHIVASFTAFKAKHKRVYATEAEHNFRLATFHANMKLAEEHNAKNLGSTYGVTKFSDLTKAEFKKQYLGFKPSANRVRPPKKVFSNLKNVNGSNVDWRGTNASTPVKDQGQCGSCWAFSATEAVETGYWKATGDQVILAPQQTTSCDQVDYGCNGGDTISAYNYMRQAGGVELESDYPYTSGNNGNTGRCKANSSEFAVKVGATTTIAEGSSDESNMMQAIQDSPMSICVDAESWQMYMGGVVDSSTCGTDLDHCVQVVGLKNNYWIVKNSWNTDWGESGYIRVATGENACGIAEEATIVAASAE